MTNRIRTFVRQKHPVVIVDELSGGETKFISQFPYYRSVANIQETISKFTFILLKDTNGR
jgi:hypothetical protein